MLLAAAGLVVLAAVLIALLAGADDRKSDRTEAQAALVAKERARLKREQRPQRFDASELKPRPGASDASVLRARAGLVDRAAASIKEEALKRERAGTLTGPITASSCKPISTDPEAVPDDQVLTKRFGRYRCLAEIRDVPGTEGGVVAKFGHPWVAALDFQHFTYVICRDTPAQSERGVALATVRLDRACLAATGKAIGDGYADVPDPPLER